ncbi:MAG: argininosuccinate lyase [Opitutia bacterium TMED67]|nr:argininosuccinate lyase [Verrucomicrobiales bacterium]OUU68852.1 MAG: argininosuccinate lyase [Opitutae bacterium TMED67]|tara:strand:+ start:1609 stop:3009 length:1401 start_codon:yes stop_codon:yes gene_type:complete
MNKKSPLSRSGRFTSGPGEDVAKFTESISFDRRLWRHDLLGSIAHATMLGNIGVLSKAESKRIVKVLEAIGVDIEEGRFEWNESLEDVHMNIEAELTRREPAGAKLHTGRSRNDQVALDMRMWLRDEMVELEVEISSLQRSLVELGVKNDKVILPGYTHLQRAQPVYFAHHLLAYVEMFARDHERLLDAFSRVNVCPLGSGALAGSTLPLDRKQVAEFLGFEDSKGRPVISQNSMDAVSDRDFAVEFCFIASMTGVHLSRLAEDLILWSSSEFDYIRISDEYTTGSSLMPQKKNPDIAEIARGKSGRLIGNLVSLLTLLKGLPMAYNRDLQEDKERLFDSVDTIRTTVRLMSSMLSNISVKVKSCEDAACDPGLLATDLADYLVNRKVAFREAHHIVGALVALAEKLKKPLNLLTLKDMQSVSKKFKDDALEVFNLKKALDKRIITGSPSSKEVKKQLRFWSKRLS